MRMPESKCMDLADLQAERTRIRAQGRVFVFTNGCFDILHVGHVNYLAFARTQGDVLCVGINSDASVRRIKGPSRPVVPQRDRARILAALESVDYVVAFDEDRVDRLVGDLLPDILVKGADWAHDVHGREQVERNGGRIVLAPVSTGHSTTNIIGTILSGNARRPNAGGRAGHRPGDDG